MTYIQGLAGKIPVLLIKVIFDRELCSKVLKVVLLLFFLLAWNQVYKMLQMEQKKFANKICSTTNKKCSNLNKKCPRTKFLQNRTKEVTKETKNVHNENCS